MASHRRRLIGRAAYAALLAALIAFSYGPSLKHLPRADDWWFYLNALDTHTVTDTFLANHSYARTRTVMPGDEFIYRPLFFALLAFKKDGIGPRFEWAQALPLALHFAFCWLLMLILARLKEMAYPLYEGKRGLTQAKRRRSVARKLSHSSERVRKIGTDPSEATKERSAWSVPFFGLCPVDYDLPGRVRKNRTDPSEATKERRRVCPLFPVPARAPLHPAATMLVYALPAFVAVNAALLEAVIWTHITGYLLFYVLMLLVLYLLLRGADPLRVSTRAVGVCIALLMLASAFLYEYGQFYSVILAPWALFWNRPVRDRLALAAVLVAIPVVYQAANAVDKRRHAAEVAAPANMDVYSNTLSQTVAPETFAALYRFMRYAGGVPLFPSTAQVNEKEERVLVQELSVRRALREAPQAWAALLLLPAGLVLAAAGYLHALRDHSYPVPAFALTLAVLTGLYALGISLVRVNPDAEVQTLLAGSSYYMYWPFALLLAVFAAGLMLFFRYADHPLARTAAAVVTAGLLLYLAVEGTASAVHLRRANLDLAEQQAHSRRIVRDVADFLDAHPAADVAFDLEHSVRVPDTWDLGVPLTTLVFRGREDNFQPDYVLRIREDGVEAAPAPEPAPPGNPLVPHLAHVGRNLNVYLHDGTYYGLLRFEGRYDPDRTDYRYLTAGESVDEVLAREPEILAKRDRDVASGALRDRYWH